MNLIEQRGAIDDVLDDLGADELALVLLVARRLRTGRRAYGAFTRQRTRETSRMRRLRNWPMRRSISPRSCCDTRRANRDHSRSVHRS